MIFDLFCLKYVWQLPMTKKVKLLIGIKNIFLEYKSNIVAHIK